MKRMATWELHAPTTALPRTFPLHWCVQVMSEGEALSRKQLAQETTIKKLRTQVKELGDQVGRRWCVWFGGGSGPVRRRGGRHTQRSGGRLLAHCRRSASCADWLAGSCPPSPAHCPSLLPSHLLQGH